LPQSCSFSLRLPFVRLAGEENVVARISKLDRHLMTTLRTPFLCALALTALALLSGCASWTQHWKEMRARQDAEAAAWVDTDAASRSQAEKDNFLRGR
jgi:hypothetical protein